MKNTLLLIGLAALTTLGGCKKDEAPAKDFVLASYGETGLSALVNVSYNAKGQPAKMSDFNGTAVIEFFYSGDKLIKRKSTNSGTVTIDSIFYDSQGHIIAVTEWDDATNTKELTKNIVYNQDNTINSIAYDYESAATPDVLYEFDYTSGTLSALTIYITNAGLYTKDTKIEFLAYDNQPNPFARIYRPYLADEASAFSFFIAYPNNLTSGKQTNYDQSTGLISSVSTISLSYSYNENGLPTRMDALQDGILVMSMTMTYTEL